MNLNSGRRSLKLSCRHCSKIGDTPSVISSLIFLRDQWLPACSVFCFFVQTGSLCAESSTGTPGAARFWMLLVASCRRCYFQWWVICRSYGTCLRPPTKNSLFYVSFGFPTNLNCTLVPWVGAGPKLNLLGFERNTTHWMLQVIQVIRCCCLHAVLCRFQISWGFP